MGKNSEGYSNMLGDRRYRNPCLLYNYELCDIIDSMSRHMFGKGFPYIQEAVKRLRLDSGFVRDKNPVIEYKYKIGEIVEVDSGLYWDKPGRWDICGIIIDYASSDVNDNYIGYDIENIETGHVWSYHQNELRIAVNPPID